MCIGMAMTAANDSWLIPLTESGTLLLYLLPAAGAGARTYRTWRDAAPNGLEVVAVQPPGREERFGEAPYTDVTPLADQVASQILGADDRPFGLFGHSAGGVVAHEVAKRIPVIASGSSRWPGYRHRTW